MFKKLLTNTQKCSFLVRTSLHAVPIFVLILIITYVVFDKNTSIVEGTAIINIGNGLLEEESLCVKSYKINDNIVRYIDTNSTKTLVLMDRVKSIEDAPCSRRVIN